MGTKASDLCKLGGLLVIALVYLPKDANLNIFWSINQLWSRKMLCLSWRASLGKSHYFQQYFFDTHLNQLEPGLNNITTYQWQMRTFSLSPSWPVLAFELRGPTLDFDILFAQSISLDYKNCKIVLYYSIAAKKIFFTHRECGPPEGTGYSVVCDTQVQLKTKAEPELFHEFRWW